MSFNIKPSEVWMTGMCVSTAAPAHRPPEAEELVGFVLRFVVPDPPHAASILRGLAMHTPFALVAEETLIPLL